jgi:hypothetical protein
MMRIRTMVGGAVVGAAAVAAVAGGVAYATADESEPTLRIVTERESGAQQSDREDCPEESTAEGAGL